MEIVKGTGPRRRVAVIGRDERGDWTIEAGRENERRYRAVLPLTGPEADDWVAKGAGGDCDAPPARVVKLAEKVLTRERHKLTEPQASSVAYATMYLDGEERVDLYPITKHNVVDGRPGHIGSDQEEVVAAWVSCNSPRCVETITETINGREETRRRGWRRLVVWFPGRIETDPRHKPLYGGGVKGSDTDIDGRDPFEVKGEHITWHRETFGVHPRVRLDWWLAANPGFGWAEVDREDLDKQLSIARAEQAEQRAAGGRSR